MRRAVLVAVVLVVVATGAVWSAELADVTMPDEVTVSGKTLVLNGMGVRKKLWVKVYVGGLYLESKTTDASEAADPTTAKRMVMHFLTNKAKKGKMDSSWDEGFANNAPEATASLGSEIETFKGYFGDMKVGDVVEMTWVPGEGTTVVLNGEEQGVIEGETFAEALFKVWVGPKPPTEDLRAGLLGL